MKRSFTVIILAACLHTIAPAAEKQKTTSNFASKITEALKDPEILAGVEGTIHALLRSTYSKFITDEKLPAAAAERLLDVQAKKHIEASHIAMEHRIDSPDIPGLKEKLGQVAARCDKELQQLLGKVAYQRLKTFEEEAFERGIVEQIATKMDDRSSPLSREQVLTLRKLASDERSRIPELQHDLSRNPFADHTALVGAAKGSGKLWRAVEKRAHEVLSPDQMLTFTQICEEEALSHKEIEEIISK